MILYLRDWAKYPNATVHTSTKNESFLEMHLILKKMGIVNNAFFLALHNPELEHVDPFDIGSLTPELMIKIALECKHNPWYFIREIVRLPASGTDPVRFRLNRAALFIFWSFFNSVTVVVIQPRQTGKTITSETLINLLVFILYKNTRIKLFTHSNELIYENIDKFKTIRDELPAYLVSFDRRVDTDNKSSIAYEALGNAYVSKTAQKAVSAALNVGRGGTVLVNQIDEGPFCSNMRVSYPVLMNSKNAATENARKNNVPHADLNTTTAGMLDTDSGRYFYEIIQKAMTFHEFLYDLDSNADLRTLLKNNSQNNMLFGEFSFRQLGFSREWADNVIRENNLSHEDGSIDRDIYNKWTLGSDKPAISTEVLNMISDGEMLPVEHSEVKGYVFRWYEEERKVWADRNRFFVLGTDTSDNIGEDFTTLHLLDISDLSTIMTSRCNDSDLLDLAEYVAKLLIEHDNVVWIPERKSTASVLISLVCAELWKEGINPFTRIYNRVFQNKDVPPFDRMSVSGSYASQGPTKKYIGYPTSPTGENSRDALYKLTLGKCLRINHHSVRDKNLIKELRALSIHKTSGRIDHKRGLHDDSVVSMLLAAWLVLHGKNLHMYGMPENLKLSKVSSEGTQVDVSKLSRQRNLSRRVAEITRHLSSTSDLVVLEGLKQEKAMLESQLLALGAEVVVQDTIGDRQTLKQGTSINDFLSNTLSNNMSDFIGRIYR